MWEPGKSRHKQRSFVGVLRVEAAQLQSISVGLPHSQILFWKLGKAGMTIDETQKKLNSYFTEKLETFGTTAKGVDYNGEQARQILRAGVRGQDDVGPGLQPASGGH